RRVLFRSRNGAQIRSRRSGSPTPESTYTSFSSCPSCAEGAEESAMTENVSFLVLATGDENTSVAWGGGITWHGNNLVGSVKQSGSGELQCFLESADCFHAQQSTQR